MASHLSAFDKVKLIFGSFGTMVGGGLIYIGPQGIAEEIPLHQPIGLIFLGFGALMFLALFSVRAKSLLLAFCVGSMSGLAVWTALFAGSDLPLWQRGLIGIIGALASFYAIYCLISVFTGEDPVDSTTPDA